MQKTLEALRQLIKAVEEDSKNESDDFNYWLIMSEKQSAQKALYQLTRGKEGKINLLNFNLIEVENKG